MSETDSQWVFQASSSFFVWCHYYRLSHECQRTSWVWGHHSTICEGFGTCVSWPSCWFVLWSADGIQTAQTSLNSPQEIFLSLKVYLKCWWLVSRLKEGTSHVHMARSNESTERFKSFTSAHRCVLGLCCTSVAKQMRELMLHAHTGFSWNKKWIDNSELMGGACGLQFMTPQAALK